MRLDDFVCLGRTVPEDSKRYGRKVCMAGYSQELHSFARVYPLPVQNPIRQRSQCVLELERNRQDSRIESWRLRREAQSDGIVSVGREVPKNEVWSWLEDSLSPSIRWLNERRRSLGVLRPRGLGWHFRERGTGEPSDPDQRLLFDDLDAAFEPDVIRLAPYLSFHDQDGPHQLQLREWGCYEWLRKEPERASQLWDNLRLTGQNLDVLLVVGNMANCRTSWLVISMYTREKLPESLFAGMLAEDC